MESYFPDEFGDGYATGWNACIDAITGEVKQMERLTERYDITPDGESDIWVKQHDYISAARKLCDYEDLEEQGLLVRLPDDLKKKVYRITYEYTECSNFGETKNNCENYNCNRDCDSQKRFYIVENRLEFMLFCNYYHELGKTVFLTREEAEKKLEDIQNDKT